MLRIGPIVASALLALGAGRPLAAQEGQGAPARLGVVEGEILVQASEMAGWTPAPSNTPLGPGDRLWVAGRGRAEIRLPAGNVVRLGNETRLEIRVLPGGDRPETPPEPSPLPTPLASYASDFATYGHWVWTPDYGYAWVPVVPVGWTPFRLGRWIWWREDLVWVADEPWGWVPFHYGRWHFHPVFGWVWVPPVGTVVVWHPAVVGWIHGTDFVAWCPLAPGEVGPGVVSITNVNVTNIWVTNVLKDATSIASRGAFAASLRGRRVAAFAPAKDLVLNRERVSIGPPPRPATLSVGTGVVRRGTAGTTAGPLKAHDRPVLGFLVPPPTAEGSGSVARPGGIGHAPAPGLSGPSQVAGPGRPVPEAPPAAAPENRGSQGLASPPPGSRLGVSHGPGLTAVGSTVAGPPAVGPVTRGLMALPRSVPSSGVVVSPGGPGRNTGPAMTGTQRPGGVVGPAVRGQGVTPLGVTPPAAGGFGGPSSP